MNKKINNLEKENEVLKTFIDRFVLTSNGLSIWVRMDHGENLPNNLKTQLQELYNLQLEVERELNLYKLQGVENETERNVTN